MEVFGALVEAEEFVDVFDGLAFDPEFGIEGVFVWSEGESRQQVKVSSAVHRILAVKPFCHLKPKRRH